MKNEPTKVNDARAPVERGGVRAEIARRWKWPVWFGVWCGGAATVLAFACPPMMAREEPLTLVVTQVACMLRTFGLQAGVGCGLIALMVWAAGLRRAALWVSLIGVVWLAPEAWKFVRPGAGGTSVAGRETLTVLSVNALYGRSSIEAIEREAAACGGGGADVVVFQEFTPGLERALKFALRDYPHRVAMSRDDAFGQAVFSKRPFVGMPEVYATRPAWSVDPQISVVVEFDGGQVRVTNVHLYPPVGLSAVRGQRKQVMGMVEDVRRSLVAREGTGSGAVERIVAGDFNGTPDGHIVQAVTSVLIDSWAQGARGRGGTWPADGVLSGLGKIRIDNLLHTSGLECVAAGLGGETGSDHLPTWARYVRRK